MAINSIDKSKMLKARRFIKVGDYQKAKSILAGINHPTATKWIIKIDEILFDTSPWVNIKTQPSSASYTNKAIVALVLLWFLFLPGYIATIVWHGEGKRAQKIAGQSLPGVGMLGILMWIGHIIFVLSVLFISFVIIVMISYPNG